jgi:membrane-associated PAP2 superfamily phosphatase
MHMVRGSNARLFAFTAAALLLVLLWDVSGLDLPMARLAATPAGFPLQQDRAFALLMHEGPRLLSWVCVAGLLAAIRWPPGFLRRLSTAERVQLALTVLASVLVVSLVKNASRTSCPWDLREFGGAARYVSHWTWGVADGGPGRCFPAGHASAAFAYVGGWFVLRRSLPRVAAAWLAAAVALGFVLGLGQQWRGAHYMSHTLWTAWLCWTTGWAIDLCVRRQRHGRLRAPVLDAGPAAKLNES